MSDTTSNKNVEKRKWTDKEKKEFKEANLKVEKKGPEPKTQNKAAFMRNKRKDNY